MHRLQTLFASPNGEADYNDALQAQIVAGAFAEAEAALASDLATLDSDLARLCLATTADKVELVGWSALYDAIEMHEGQPIAGVALGLGNDADLSFEKGVEHDPFLTLGLYTDGEFVWSGAPREAVFEQAKSAEPAWMGSDEDIEAYLTIEGLAAINTALIHHKRRFFFRDDSPLAAPPSYVEYVLGCWWRALRFHQAVAEQVREHGLPDAAWVVVGTIDMRPEIACIHRAEARREAESALALAPKLMARTVHDEDDEAEGEEASRFASLTRIAVKLTPVEEEEEAPSAGSQIRRRVSAPPAEAAIPQPARGGWLRNLFRRRSAA